MAYPGRMLISTWLLRLSVFACFFSSLASAQVDYRLSFQPSGSSWQVEARFPGRGEDALDFWIARWTGGAYHLADYGRFVKDLTATDEAGKPLAVERDGDSHFVVRGKDAKEIVLSYRGESISKSVFSEGIIDVESNRIAEEYAFVNPVSLFGFVPGRVDEQVRLAVELPKGWTAATVLAKDGEGRFTAPSFYRFEDSPLFFAKDLATSSFEVAGKQHQITVHGRSGADAQAIATGCRKVVESAARLLQGLPYERYHFLFGFVSEGGGSGLEHSDSTLILVARNMPVSEDSETFWGIVAHEFVHLWCAERIHVQELQRPDYTQPFKTGTIWVNEGVTEYFTRHVLLHAGLLDSAEFFEGFAGAFPELPGAKKSWTQVSRDAEDWESPMDLGEFAMRMYALGPRTILALDLAMRGASEGERGVLDLLRHLIDEYVEKDRGFGEQEMNAIIDHVAEADLDFYERYIDGTEMPDISALLGVIGYRLAEGRIVPVDEPSAAQLAAREDFLSADG